MATKNKAKPATKQNSLENEQKQIAVKLQRLDLKKRLRDDSVAEEASQLDLRTKRAMAARAELDLVQAQNAQAKFDADDAANAEYLFHDGVTWETAKQAIKDLNKISRLNEGKPLTITLNSPGGSVLAGLAMYDHIRELSARGHHVTVKVRGMAASMGGILLQAGDTRIVGPEALVLIHEVSSGTFGKVGEMQESLDFSKQLWVKLAKILAKRSSMSAKEIMAKAHKFDWWIDAKTAKRLGFADEIG